MHAKEAEMNQMQAISQVSKLIVASGFMSWQAY